jgi:hypothetical protein
MIHDAAFAIAFRMLELMRSSIPDHAHQESMAEFYEIARQEVGHYERARAQQEARLNPARTT